MKVVLDTNVLFAALSSRTAYYPIWQYLQGGAYEICVTTDILNEYEEKLQEHFRPSVAENTMAFFMASPDIIHVTKYYFWNLITSDPDDNKFVDCAIAANADFIVSEDRHFRILKKLPFPIVRVISADDFVETLTGQRPQRASSLSKNKP
jgi:putative PIN family toxin of toxin-antitoxin system